MTPPVECVSFLTSDLRPCGALGVSVVAACVHEHVREIVLCPEHRTGYVVCAPCLNHPTQSHYCELHRETRQKVSR